MDIVGVFWILFFHFNVNFRVLMDLRSNFWPLKVKNSGYLKHKFPILQTLSEAQPLPRFLFAFIAACSRVIRLTI